MHKPSVPGILLALLIFISTGFSQTKSNLDIFYSMIDSSANQIINYIPAPTGKIKLEFNSGDMYLALENRLIRDLTEKGVKISEAETDSGYTVRYIIEHADLTYGELFRKGFLGSYYVRRDIKLSGNFIVLNSNTKIKNFSFARIDTVQYGNMKNTENPAFPFTRGKIPSEPLFSSLIEPVVAIGAAAAAVILFFTVRSK